MQICVDEQYLYAHFDISPDTKYLLNEVYNLHCFFSFWELRPQTLTRGSAPEAHSGIYVPQTPIRDSALEPHWGTSVIQTLSEIGPP